MSNSANDPAAQVVEAIAKQLPVREIYNDAFKSSAQEAGNILADLVKTARLALAPFQLLGAAQDRFNNFIEHSIRRVPHEQRIPPAPQILGPVLEGIRYETEGTPISEMFSQLLSRSMDRERSGEAHPSYPTIIKQLSSDEARILELLSQKEYYYVYMHIFDQNVRKFTSKLFESVDIATGELSHPNMVDFYCCHLEALGLAEIIQIERGTPVFEQVNGIETEKQIGMRITCKLTLTEMGKHFFHACTG